MDTSWNGLWIDRDGDPFIIAAPHTIWAEFGGRHYSAFDLRCVDNGGYYGEFEDSPNVILSQVGPTRDQERAQWDLIGDKELKGEGPSFGELPLVPRPEASADSGHISIKPGSTNRILKIGLETADQRVPFNDQIYFVGSSPKLSIDGTYASGEVSLTVHESGERAKRKIDGTLTLLDTTMTLHGHRIWSRGGFLLVDRDTNDIVGGGWLIWHPSKKFAKSMLSDGIEGPTDQLDAWVYLNSGKFPTGIPKTLTRQG